jgi:type IV pilus assembly protein PilE
MAQPRSTLRLPHTGISLLELAVIAVAVGVLAAVALPAYQTHQSRQDDREAREYVEAVVPAIERYRAAKGSYTGMTLAGLVAFAGELDPSEYALPLVSSETYCVESTVGSRAWHKDGPTGTVARGHCPS